MVGLLLTILVFNLHSPRVSGEFNEKDFVSYAGRRIKNTSTVEHLTSVTVIECVSTCFSSKGCCAISYSPNINACLLNVANTCYPETENDNNWNLWKKIGNIEESKSDVGQSTVHRPFDCGDVHGESGVYTIYGAYPEFGFDVLCDMDTDGGGWTVFQKRMNGEIDFYLGWSEYEDGFGDLRREFWMGNKHLYKMTSQHSCVLRIVLEDFENSTRYAQYETFYISDPSDKYRLTIGNFSGDAGDSLVYSNGMQFTTKDQDNDKDTRQCAQSYKGAWWYKTCLQANLNGPYVSGPHTAFGIGVDWWTWKGLYYSLKSVKMMIRRLKT